MAYSFTNWNSVTDPSGATRTLDWTPAGMAGQPPIMYLEALRQAAILRDAVTPTYSWFGAHGHSYPPEIRMDRAALQRIAGVTGVCHFVKWVAFDAPALIDAGYDCTSADGSESCAGGWVMPTNRLSDYSGTSGGPDTSWSTPNVTALLGEPYCGRIANAGNELDFLWIKWALHHKALLQAMTVSVGHWRPNPSLQVGGSKVAPASSFAGCAAGLAAAAWGGYPGDTYIQHFIRNMSGGGITWYYGRRDSVQVRWRPVNISGVPDCTAADVYVKGTKPLLAWGAGYGTYENIDYPVMPDGTLGRLRAGIDLTGPANTEWIGHITPTTVTAPDRGWLLDQAYVVCDWGSTWALGA